MRLMPTERNGYKILVRGRIAVQIQTSYSFSRAAAGTLTSGNGCSSLPEA